MNNSTSKIHLNIKADFIRASFLAIVDAMNLICFAVDVF